MSIRVGVLLCVLLALVQRIAAYSATVRMVDAENRDKAIGNVKFEFNAETNKTKVSGVLRLNVAQYNSVQLHGFHIHELPVDEPGDCDSAKSHYNPHKKSHGDRGKVRDNRHVGDLGNIACNLNGLIATCVVQIIDNIIEIGTGSLDDVAGRTLVLHKSKDTLNAAGKPIAWTGDAGTRIACGVLECSNCPTRDQHGDIVAAGLGLISPFISLVLAFC